MKSLILGISSAITGALITVVVMLSIGDIQSLTNNTGVNEEIVALSARMQQTENILLDIKKNLVLIEKKNSSMMNANYLPQSQSSGEVGEGSNSTPDKLSINSKAIEDKIVQNVERDISAEDRLISRLSDTSYTSSNSIVDFMSSDEVRNLSSASRKNVVEKMILMLNSGEIDAAQFSKKITK